MKKINRILAVLCACLLAAGCGQEDTGGTGGMSAAGDGFQISQGESGAAGGELQAPQEESRAGDDGSQMEEALHSRIKIDESTTYQTMESFGTSGAWWSQYVGGFTEDANGTGSSSREDIARLLFDREEGIGLTCYRYNLGAGSVESRNGTFQDIHRRAQCFETEAGVYDFSKDENAVWFLKRACELGVEEVVLFCNSPLVRLTDNGLPHMSEGGSRSNLSPENYAAFATYCMDVTEHFVEEGIPVKFLSPINEPQWDWYNGQEGCHYSPKETAAVYLAFLDELESRPGLAGVKLSGPESGEWKGEATAYTSAVLNNERLREHFDTIDNHSYWSEDIDKKAFKNWMVVHHPEKKLRTSEWCEMVNGSDVTMDSAFHIAQEIASDIRILEVVSWQNWVGVAPGGYRDGLIYIDEKSQKYRALKRLWAFGNYSRYVRPGYVRVEIETSTRDQEEMLPTAFVGTNDLGQRELVMVFINEGVIDQEFLLEGVDGYRKIAMYVTSDDYDLECVLDADYSADMPVSIPMKSIATVVLAR